MTCVWHGRRSQGANLALPVALLHVAAFSMGYFLCKGLGFNEKTSRTVSIETGALNCHASVLAIAKCTMRKGGCAAVGAANGDRRALKPIVAAWKLHAFHGIWLPHPTQ